MNWYKYPKVKKETLGPDGFLIIPNETVWFNRKNKDLRVEIFKSLFKDQHIRIGGITREAPYSFVFSIDGVTIREQFYVTRQGAVRKAETFMKKVKSEEDFNRLRDAKKV